MRKPDRRPERTREHLHRALLELVVERGYEKIAVQDILDRANIGRSTFYIHFADKDDLLLSGMAPLHATLMQVVDAPHGEGQREVLSFIPPLFDHSSAYRSAFRALGGRAKRNAEHQMLAMLRELLEAEWARSGNSGAPFARGATHGIASGVMGLIDWWILQEPQRSASAMSELALEIFGPSARNVAQRLAREGYANVQTRP